MKEKRIIKKRVACLALCLAMALSLHTPFSMDLCETAYAAEELPENSYEGVPIEEEPIFDDTQEQLPEEYEEPTAPDGTEGYTEDYTDTTGQDGTEDYADNGPLEGKPVEEPEVTETPTTNPEPGVNPEPSEEPIPTAEPLPSEEPIPTEEPVPTEEPAATEEPEPTEEPVLAYKTLEATDAETGTSVIITGELPEGAYATITPVEVPQLMMEVLKLSLTEETAQSQQTIAYDVSIFDAEHNEIEPTSAVNVEFKFGAAIPADAGAAESMAIIHVEEDANGEISNLVDVGAEAAVVPADEQSDAAQTELVANFQVESFSTFVITWQIPSWPGYPPTDYFKINVHYVTTSNDPLGIAHDDQIISGVSSWNDERFFEGYAPFISGFKYKEARLGDKSTGLITDTTVASVKASYSQSTITFYKDGKEIESGRYRNKIIEYDVYLVYEVAETSSPTTPNEPDISHNKTATRNDDGTYDITLDVKGTADAANGKKKLDVLFILDKSGSMKDGIAGWFSGSKMALLQKCVNDFTNTLSSNTDLDVYYDVVAFSEYKHNHGSTGTEITWTNDNDYVNRVVNGIGPEGGTNYQGGIYEGIEDLKDARPDAERVVIFLTDGIPTFRGGMGDTKEEGDGSKDDDGKNGAAAKEQIRGLSCNQFYAIGVGSEFAQPGLEGQKNLMGLANNVGDATTRPAVSEVHGVNNSEDLTDIFDQIAALNNKFEISNVTITDNLSQYVKPIDGEPLKIVVKDKDNKVVLDSSKTADARNVTLQKTENNEAAKITASIDVNGKVVLDFEDGYKLEPGWTYSVTVKVKPAQKAYEDYAQNGGYPKNDKGETITGADGTGTHVKQPGFPSNDGATLEYSFNDDPVEPPKKYPDPVIQLDLGTLVVKKTIKGLTDTEVEDLKKTLSFTVTLGDTETSYTLDDFETVTGAEGEHVYELTIGGLAPDTTYTVEETGYDLAPYVVTRTKTGETGTIVAKETARAEFVNEYGEEPTYSLKITKILDNINSKMGDDASFLFKAVGPDGKEYSRLIHFNAAGTASAELITDLPGGTYTVTELSAIGYKATSDMTQKITLDKNTPNGVGEVTFRNTTTGSPYGDSASAKNLVTFVNGQWTVSQADDGNRHS